MGQTGVALRYSFFTADVQFTWASDCKHWIFAKGKCLLWLLVWEVTLATGIFDGSFVTMREGESIGFQPTS